MDPESWKMSTTSYKRQNPQRDMTVPRTLQVNHTRYLPADRFGKRACLMVNDEPTKMEGRFLHVDGKSGYKRSLYSVDQGEERMIVMSKHSISKWANQVPDSYGHRENLTFISCGNNLQTTRAHCGVEPKRFPTLNRDFSRTYIPKQDKAHFQLLREGGNINNSSYLNAKDPIREVHGVKNNVDMEPILVEDDDDEEDDDEEDDESEDSILYPEILFNASNNKIMRPNIASFQAGAGKQLNRSKLSGQVSSVYTEEQAQQNMLGSHRTLYRDLPSASRGCPPKDTLVSSFQSRKLASSICDESKGQHSVKQKDKSAGNSTLRRFLLIDSQGLPYTVVVEESKPSKDGSTTNESFSDIKNSAASKSVAPRKVYKCPVCFRIFEYLSYLQRHSIAHSQQKPHVCKICGKAFKRTSHLTRHKYTHFGGKPSQCQVCHRRFRDIAELSRHQLSHTGERPYLCEVCHMHFGEHSTLQHHMLAKH